VAFESFAPDLVAGDTNGVWDVFVRDRVARTTQRVSVGVGGDEAGLDSKDAAISSDGRYVAFESVATNLVPGDTNDEVDVFVRDMETQLTQRVSLGPGGTEGNNGSRDAAISGDGGNVAFSSFAFNLVPGDTNGRQDVFLWDQETQVTQRVSVGPDGAEANSESIEPAFPARGRYLAFTSGASNLVAGDNNNVADVFVRDLVAEVNRRVPLGSNGRSGSRGMPSVARRGGFVAFVSNASDLVARDTNGVQDVFVRQLFG
jgi:Tol biopolymer transport system component